MTGGCMLNGLMRLLRPLLTTLPVIGLVVAIALAAGCGDPPNTQYLPIGQRCGSGDDCGTAPYDCATANHPGGYCERTCATDGDCPSDSYCIAMAPTSHCRRKCTTDTECRAVEGYVCKPNGTLGKYCDIPQ